MDLWHLNFALQRKNKAKITCMSRICAFLVKINLFKEKLLSFKFISLKTQNRHFKIVFGEKTIFLRILISQPFYYFSGILISCFFLTRPRTAKFSCNKVTSLYYRGFHHTLPVIKHLLPTTGCSPALGKQIGCTRSLNTTGLSNSIKAMSLFNCRFLL